MIRYRLDDLGWYQFEWLIQSLLKAHVSIGVESWGASRDHGKDAYFAGDLNFTSDREKDAGPFLFQVKFINNANAAGANIEPLIKAAINAEVRRITLRKKNKQWDPIGYYCFYTNALLTPGIRKYIKQKIKSVCRSAEVKSFGGSDVCDHLDNHEQIRRSFPQLLGLRDIDQLLADVVNNDILTVSKSAIGKAREVIPVFVPTKAYNEALQKIRRNFFVVLEGPPEMGKTAIAWVIALSYLLDGYEAYLCLSPDDFKRVYRQEKQQIFIADDAFGRTEYEPSRLREWEPQLEYILRLLDEKHSLIWTSRKHILQRALKEVDFQGVAEKFPKPGDVYVDASYLSIEERSLILYRHIKNVKLDADVKKYIKNFAERIVRHKSFTPERIRKFAVERLPKILQNYNKKLNIDEEIIDAISNPTDQMRKTFRPLDTGYKLLLLSLLESQPEPDLKQVKELYEKYGTKIQTPSFESIVEDLAESFIRISHV